MNKRLTISLPGEFYQQLKRQVAKGKWSQFITTSLLNESDSCLFYFSQLLAKQQKNKLQILAQPLLNLEVANAFRFAINDKKVLNLLMTDFFNLDLDYLFLSNDQAKYTLQLANDLNTTVYNTSYHVLAIAFGAIFVTADAKYYNKAKNLGSIKLVK